MTIGYSTKWPKSMGPEYAGKPNHFVEKIWAGLISRLEHISIEHYSNHHISHLNQFGTEMSEYNQIYIDPKVHTFRQDPKDRWKVGMKIHSVINNRTKNRFQFTPILEVKSIQKVEIIYSNEEVVELEGVEPVIKVDDKALSLYEMEVIAVNDGFEDLCQFLHWFNKDFSGKIIHWTNIKY